MYWKKLKEESLITHNVVTLWRGACIGITSECNLKVCMYMFTILTLSSFRHTFLFSKYPACQEMSTYKQQLHHSLLTKRNWITCIPIPRKKLMSIRLLQVHIRWSIQTLNQKKVSTAVCLSPYHAYIHKLADLTQIIDMDDLYLFSGRDGWRMRVIIYSFLLPITY